MSRSKIKGQGQKTRCALKTPPRCGRNGTPSLQITSSKQQRRRFDRCEGVTVTSPTCVRWAWWDTAGLCHAFLVCENTARQICAMVRRWRILANFCVLYYQRAACGGMQHISDLHSKFAVRPCGSMVDFQSATADNRRKKKKAKEEEEDRNHRCKI